VLPINKEEEASAKGESAVDRKEFEAFGHQEFEAKISDISETWRAMHKAADKIFGTAMQERLF